MGFMKIKKKFHMYILVLTMNKKNLISLSKLLKNDVT